MPSETFLTIKDLNSDRTWDYENGFFWFSKPLRLSKVIAHYELYKQCINLPGAMAEFGVYKGNSLFQFATFRAMLELPDAREIYAFDAFGSFPKNNINNIDDIEFINYFENAGRGE